MKQHVPGVSVLFRTATMTQSGGVNVRSAVAEDRLEVLQVYRLLQCVREGDTPPIEKMVRLGVPNLINLTEPNEGNAAMHLASVANDTDMVRFLLSQGAHPNVQDKKGRTPVILAAQLGHDNMVALLAKNHANMDVVDTEGKGTLFYCISPTKRHMRCLQVALNSKANVNNVSTAGTPIFLMACERAHDCENMCISILERGADPNATNEASGRSALMEAARAGAVELVRAILQKGGNPNAVDKKRMHAAHLAAEGGFFEVIVVLSAYSADLSCNAKLKNIEGLIPSQMAKNNNQKPAMKELKKAERLEVKFSKPGAVNPNELWALTLHDWSCEHEASLRTAMEIAEEAVGPVETVTRETFVAVLQDHRAPVDDENLQKVILEHDKKREGLINVTDFFKGVRYLQKTFTLPSYEPKKKKAGKGERGKKKGKFVLPMPICIVPPELICRRQDGGPPHFMVESYQQFTDTKRFDRDHPPGHPIEDDSAWYVDEPEKIYININYCVKTGDLESLSLAFSVLIRYSADVNTCDQFSWTPLHHASHAGQVDIVDLLVHSGSVVDAVAMNGATPLMRAIESCRPCCVDYLIKAGARVQAENKKAYGDIRIRDLVQDKFDSLPKSKEGKGKGGAKPKPANQAAPKDNIIFLNTQITSGATNLLDISFVPKT
ncbi:unnamed protein product, partial [Coregonus sp. 'balchen']